LQKNAQIYRRHPPPKSGLYPDDYYWDTNKKQWVLRAIRLDMIKPANLSKLPWVAEKGQITGKDKEGNFLKPEDFYWDIEEGLYISKNPNDTYFVDADGVWKSEKLRKKKRNRRYPHDYYMDEKKKEEFILKDKALPEDKYTFDSVQMIWRLTKGFDEKFNEESKVKDNYFFDMEKETWEKKTIATVNISVNDPLCKFSIKRLADHSVKIPDEFW